MSPSVLNFNNTQASGLSRFTNWSTINATNGSQLTLDNNGLTLGNSGTLTGTLNVDSTSTLFAGGFGDPRDHAGGDAGQLVTVNNAGTIDLTNGGDQHDAMRWWSTATTWGSTASCCCRACWARTARRATSW